MYLPFSITGKCDVRAAADEPFRNIFLPPPLAAPYRPSESEYLGVGPKNLCSNKFFSSFQSFKSTDVL